MPIKTHTKAAFRTLFTAAFLLTVPAIALAYDAYLEPVQSIVRTPWYAMTAALPAAGALHELLKGRGKAAAIAFLGALMIAASHLIALQMLQ